MASHTEANPAPDVAASQSTTPSIRRRSAFTSNRILAIAMLLGLTALTVWRLWRFDPLAAAEAAWRKGDTVTALRIALDRLDRRPGQARAAIIAARCLIKLGFPDRANPYFQTARRAGLVTVDDDEQRALILAEASRTEEAAAVLQAILAAHPNRATALQRLAAVRFSQTRWKDALPLARRLTELRGHEEDGWALIGSIEHEQKHPDRAAEAYEKVLALDPELDHLPVLRPVFWTNLARDLVDSGQPVKARRFLERSLAEKNDPVQMDLLGMAYQWEGSLDDAERCYRQAIDWDAQLFPAWLHLGRLMLLPSRNRLKDAVEYLTKAAELAPTSFEPVYSLSLAYRRLGETDRADELQQQAEELRKQAGPPATGMGAMP